MSISAISARAICLGLLLFAAMAIDKSMATNTSVPSNTVYFHRFYSGKIGDKYAVTMDLKNLNGVLTGTYRYAGKSRDIDLQGNMDPGGSFTMDESDISKRTGVFTGVLNDKKITGAWQSADGRRKWPFLAEQTSEIKIGSKKEILTTAIGDYSLASISGSGGANGMWDTWKEKGKWKSSTSGISGGMRQANTIKLTKADIHMLNSIAVTVDADLITRLLVDGKTIFTIPYRENGMQLAMKKPHNSVVEEDLKKYSPNTTVSDEHLYLMVQDDVDYSAVISGNFEAAVSDILTVSYSIVGDTFDVTFTEGNCCGNTTFAFSRRRRP